MNFSMDRRDVLYVLRNDRLENDQSPEAANAPLRSTEERVITEPPLTDKSVEMSESVSTSSPEYDNQLPPKETTLPKCHWKQHQN